MPHTANWLLHSLAHQTLRNKGYRLTKYRFYTSQKKPFKIGDSSQSFHGCSGLEIVVIPVVLWYLMLKKSKESGETVWLMVVM